MSLPTTLPPRPAATPRPKPENLWLNLICNIAAPALILSRFSAETRLGPMKALLVGLAFPLGYGIYDLARRRKWNMLSLIGLFSVGLSGGFGLLKVGGMGFAIKDAAVPASFAIALLATAGTRRPLVRELIMNESVMDVPRVETALAARHAHDAFARLLRRSTWMLALSFSISSVLNFIFARLIITAEPGTSEFTHQLGTMTWVSHTVLIVPNVGITIFVLWRLLAGLERLTGLSFDELFHQTQKPTAKEPPPSEIEPPRR